MGLRRMWSPPPRAPDVRERVQGVNGYALDYLGAVKGFELFRVTTSVFNEVMEFGLAKDGAFIRAVKVSELDKQYGPGTLRVFNLTRRVLKWTGAVEFLIKKERLEAMLKLAKSVHWGYPELKEGDWWATVPESQPPKELQDKWV